MIFITAVKNEYSADEAVGQQRQWNRAFGPNVNDEVFFIAPSSECSQQPLLLTCSSAFVTTSALLF